MNQSEKQLRQHRLENFGQGRDELNFAEFPLAAICDRFLDGTKTVVFEDTVWDEEKRKHLPRKLTISGSDRYGLPTSKDDDVLLACIQLSSLGDFHSREVHFSRYELLKLLRWPDETRYYRRVATSLRRWKGLTVYSDRAFYDKARKSWVNRDFGVFDNLFVYEREEEEKIASPADSWFVWNEVVYESFQAGYLKKLDWDLYCRLKDPVAKRLYRFLDKRFYRSDRLTLDLHELAYDKVRVSRNYNTAQTKRALMKGIRELEALWDLRPMEADERFRKISRGKWEAVFQKKRKTARRQVAAKPQLSGASLELTKRGVGERVAASLVANYPGERVQSMLELFDWHNERGEARGAGFLVAGIKSESEYKKPKGFRSSKQQRAAEKQSKDADVKQLRQREQKDARERAVEAALDRKFRVFWSGLCESEKARFQDDALARADRTKRDGYLRAEKVGGVIFDQYCQLILRDHFQRNGQGENATISCGSRSSFQNGA
ncbi:replication initiator protein A [Bythopirellula goksoeyrii]|uniref:Replication initiator protein A n=1 Tax=Bythopirellula goksoeyrii TaxID=1400387 RepID=A0A5B9QKY7_9BACT|nr:replication initiator protein A [Bythopirellula goksoeyrii]QEG37706.1 Replication initiator protein A [Bythopirellula goksoeyrii]